ncbi:MAG: lipid-A-disaccharide synthase N-terminal domain-containing protein [Thermoanaerobaculia bacterium]
MNNPGQVGHFLDPRSWHWDVLAVLGFCAQALFASRFIIQWIASERRKRSHIPIHFWYLSLFGGILMIVYGLLRRDPVIILGQAPGLIVYIRNLILIHRHTDADAGPTEDTASDRA